MWWQDCGSKNTITVAVIDTGLSSSPFLLGSWSTNAKRCAQFPCPNQFWPLTGSGRLRQCFPVFVHPVVWLLPGKRSSIAISYLFSYTKNVKAIILHSGNRKDFKESVEIRAAIALFYFGNALIKKTSGNRKAESRVFGGVFLQILKLGLISFGVMKSCSQSCYASPEAFPSWKGFWQFWHSEQQYTTL